MYDMGKWNFHSQMSSSNIAVIQTLGIILHVNGVIPVYCDKYGASRNTRSKYVHNGFVIDHFAHLLIDWDSNWTVCCT